MHLLQNEILVANPLLSDDHLKKSLVLKVDDEIGFIINKPTCMYINDALEDFPLFESTLYYGGPIMTDTIHFLHKYPEIEGCRMIDKGIYWGGKLDILSAMINCKMIDQKNIRFLAGYTEIPEVTLYRTTNWMKLHDKYVDPSWIKSYLFSDKPDDMYARALKLFGNNMSIFANIETPSLN